MRFLICICVLISSLSLAQDLKIGIILSQTGEAAQLGQAQARGFEAFMNPQALRTNPLGQRLQLMIRDDQSNPNRALALAGELLDEGVHALICCTLPDSHRAVAELVEGSLLTLSPVAYSSAVATGFSVQAGSFRSLQSAILKFAEQGKQTVALMAADTAIGAEAEQALELLLSPGGIRLVESLRYPVAATVLTPEALWVATRLPEAVIVWGGTADSILAYQALRVRGYEQSVLLNPALVTGDRPPARLEGGSFILSPFLVTELLPETHPSLPMILRFQSDMARAFGPGYESLESAYAYDAMLLIQAALEEALVYGVSPTDTQRFRLALKDAFASGRTVAGSTAVFRFSPQSPWGVEPRSLVLVSFQEGRWFLHD